MVMECTWGSKSSVDLGLDTVRLSWKNIGRGSEYLADCSAWTSYGSVGQGDARRSSRRQFSLSVALVGVAVQRNSEAEISPLWLAVTDLITIIINEDS